MKIDTPKVLVRCMTYNHEHYIEDALNGFLMQKTDFQFVVAVVDDASTDNNVDVIKRFISKYCSNNRNYTEEDKEYGKVIQAQAKSNNNCHFYVIFLAENHYSDPNKRALRYFYSKFIEDQTKYVAMCEGDDYWIDRHKLQKQVDFLEDNPDCQLVFHNAIVRSQEHLFGDYMMCSFETGYFNLKQVFEYWQLPHASVVFRSSIREHPIYLELIKQVSGGWCYYIAAAKIGKVYGISECMSVYRKNSGGLSNGMSLDFVIDVNYKFAYAAKSEDAVRAIDKKARNMLYNYYYAYLRGDLDARKAMAVAKTHNRYMAILVFWDHLLRLPQAGFKKMKKLVKKVCQYVK